MAAQSQPSCKFDSLKCSQCVPVLLGLVFAHESHLLWLQPCLTSSFPHRAILMMAAAAYFPCYFSSNLLPAILCANCRGWRGLSWGFQAQTELISTSKFNSPGKNNRTIESADLELTKNHRSQPRTHKCLYRQKI